MRIGFPSCTRYALCAAGSPPTTLFPPQQRMAFHDRVLEEILQERVVSSRGRRHPRGNLSWNITRALHLAGRCVNCGECERFCPVGIPLSLVNRKLQQIVAERYDYTVSEDPENPAPIGDYRLDDQQEFIK